jgi:hypothetical protein
MIDVAPERAGVHNFFAHLEIGARMSADCNIAADCNDRSGRRARPSEV